MDQNAERIWNLVSEKTGTFRRLADTVWSNPEVNYEEFASCEEHARALSAEGFTVTRQVAGLPTAVMGEAGEGGVVIAFLGEYDALPHLSQEAGVASHAPIKPYGHGHGCGHHLLGSGAMQAATAVKNYLRQENIPGRVRYYGCPAEEGGSGKGFMARNGAFKDVDAFITWHPYWFAGVPNAVTLACNEIDFHFTGRSSHAASSPHLGRSALDAVELMNVGVNYLREHIPSHARIHYAIVDAGGEAPNVVQAKATVRYVVRGRDTPELRSLVERVSKVAQGAAMMTETAMSHRVRTGEANFLGNRVLEDIAWEEFRRVGPPAFDEADNVLAEAMQKTFEHDSIVEAYQSIGLKVPELQTGMASLLFPPRIPNTLTSSTDVGNVSWLAPTIEIYGANYAVGTPFHSWQLVAQGKSNAAMKGMEHAAKVMAATGMRLFLSPESLLRAKQEHSAALSRTPYVDPIPDGTLPDLPARLR